MCRKNVGIPMKITRIYLCRFRPLSFHIDCLLFAFPEFLASPNRSVPIPRAYYYVKGSLLRTRRYIGISGLNIFTRIGKGF